MDASGNAAVARGRIAASLDAAREAAEGLLGRVAARDETGPENLAWMCATARTGLPSYPLDKTARWLGFVHGCLGSMGALFEPPGPLPGEPAAGELLHAHRVLFERYRSIAAGIPGVDAAMPDPAIPRAELSYRLGLLQGDLACRGLVRVREERAFSRPLFHAAYGKEGAVPPTLEGPGSRSP